MTRRPDIQGLRAVAVLLVIAYHAGFSVPGGFTGVDIFFVISGFVITGTLLAELSATGHISFSRFYVRRIRRLLPALALMLVFVVLVGVLTDPIGAQHQAAMTGVFASFFSANGYLYHLGTGYFDVSTTLNPLLHTWTLAVEEQFYVVFPALLALGWWLGSRRLARRRSRVVASVVIGLACVSSFVLSFALSSGYIAASQANANRLAFYASPTRAWEFGVGALLVLASPLFTRLPTWGTILAGTGGAVAIAVAAFSVHEAGFRETSALVPVGGACLLVVAGIGSQVGVSRLLSLGPLVWIGDLSYSLYLWHWPLIVFAKALLPDRPRVAVIAAALSLLPAWLSYRYVENPIRYHVRLGSRSRVAGRTAIALASVCILLPIGANTGLLKVQDRLGKTSSLTGWQRSQASHADVTRGCDSRTPLGERRDGACTWPVSSSRGEIVLVGDSYAGQFSEPVTRAGNRAGFDVTVVTASSCPFVNVRRPSGLVDYSSCLRFGSRTLKALVSLHPSLVVVATSTAHYLQDSGIALGAAGSSAITYDSRKKARLWKSALESTLLRLNRAGAPVLLVHPIPALPYDPNECAVVQVLTGGCEDKISQRDANARLRLALRVEDAAIGGASSTWGLNLENEICRGGSCSSKRGDTFQYRTADHLSVDGALMLTDSFYEEIKVHAIQRSHR